MGSKPLIDDMQTNPNIEMDLIYLQTPFTIGTVSRLMSKHKISFGALLHKILMHLLEGAMSSY